MTTTCQKLQDRAVAYSSANGLASLVSDKAEILNRIATDERALYDLAARTNRYFFATTIAITSTSGASLRSFALTALSPRVARILKIVLADGREVNQVDVQDLEAEFSPRYYVLGQTVYEVENDWSSVNATVSATLTYVQLPATIDTTGLLTQTVTLPDDFVDLLELRLARYLAHKDVGRDPAEMTRLDEQIKAREADFLSHITQFGGVEARRFTLPSSGTKV